MARTSLQASRETDGNFTSWLLRSSFISANELECVIRLRNDGFYAGHTTLEELKSFCLRNFNPFQVSLKPEARITTKGDDDAGVETHNLRLDLKKLDIFKDKILKLSMEKDITDKQKHVLGTDISEGKFELQDHVSTSLCLPAYELKRTIVLQSQLEDEPYTVFDQSKDASQVCPEFHIQGDSSGDDTEFVPNFVDCFYVTDMNNEDISLFDLPYESTASREESSLQRFYIHGMYDNGLHPIMHAVTTWKLELGQKSYFFVKTFTGKWIRLGHPTESYAAAQLRTALVVKKFLSFVNLNQAASEKEVWAHLQKKFRLSEVQPSLDDLLQHTKVIKKLLKEIPQLDHSMVVRDLLKKRKATNYIARGGKEKFQKKSKTFPFFDKEGIRNKNNLEDKESKSTMALVLDSGEHGMDTTDELDESDEKELGETVCAICDDGGDILCCDGPCLRSFHATEVAAAKSTSGCVSLHFTEHEVKEMSKFFCWNCQYKQHQCFVCGHLGSSEGEGKEVFVCDVALCGRFYHLQCVSKVLVSVEQEATFIEQVKTGSKVFSCPLHKCFTCKKGDIKENEALRLYGCRRCPRAWHKQCISNKIAFYEGDFVPGIRGWEMDGMRFLYCPHHEMDEDLGTPIRDHLVFPDRSTINKSFKEGKLSTEKVASLSEQAYQTKHVNLPVSKKFLDMELAGKMGTKVIQKPPAPAIKKSLLGANVMKTKFFPSFNGEVKKMVESVIDVSKKAVTIDTVVANLSVPNVYKGSIGSVKKYICLGKLDSILHALAKSRECFLRGAFEEARCIFPEEFVQILERSKNKLRVYLAPILHGMRYTSYGRHFTTLEKLEEIVNRLHWYVDDGDMVVDFCCGSNDFSRLMAEKLTTCCKQCEYKNFDIIQPKHDFNFTKRDWLSVKRHELPSGDRLIMGLNPPFGVFSQLANTMVQHALAFKPKLLILIVPKETKRLEECGYECIWEDPYLLSGQSFYFPGSLDINDRTLSQENNDAPPLYLWSRSDWAIRHHHIAAKQGHLEKSILIRAEILDPTQQIWSTGNSEAAFESNTHEWSQCNDLYAVHPRDGMTHAGTLDPFKARNASSEIHSGVLQKRQIEETSYFKTSSHNALLISQTCQQYQSSSHYRTVVGSRNKGQSGIQELPKSLHEQAEDLNIHSCEEITKQFQYPFKEKNEISLGGLYPGCEVLNHTKGLSLDWPRMAFPPHGNLKAYDREFLELGSHDRTGGWIED